MRSKDESSTTHLDHAHLIFRHRYAIYGPVYSTLCVPTRPGGRFWQSSALGGNKQAPLCRCEKLSVVVIV